MPTKTLKTTSKAAGPRCGKCGGPAEGAGTIMCRPCVYKEFTGRGLGF